MATLIEAYGKYGPRLARTNPVTADSVIERVAYATGQTRGSVMAVLAECDEVIVQALREGQIVHMPNGTHYRPIGKLTGVVDVRSRPAPRLKRLINAHFRGAWLNAERIGFTQEEMIAYWNEQHPEDPIVPQG